MRSLPSTAWRTTDDVTVTAVSNLHVEVLLEFMSLFCVRCLQPGSVRDALDFVAASKLALLRK